VRAEKELIESGNENPFSLNGKRSYFGPTYTGEEIEKMKEDLKALPTDFEEPVRHSR
jgi:hypothetical protein